MPKKKKNTGIRLIKKANKLVESRYKFDIWETRVFLSVLSQINREDEDFAVYRIWYKDVIKTFGLRSAQSYEFLREAARGLMRKVFYVTSMENGKKRETEYHIIRTVNYLAEGEKPTDNQDYIDITIDPEMKPLLLQLGSNYRGEKGENFTAYELRNVVKLGAYHVRIYELLKQYQRIGHRTFEVDEIKRMLEIDKEYPLFGNFFQKVVKPSVKAINKNTDLTITKLEKLKTGRKVTSLYFEFRGKNKEEKKNSDNSEAIQLNTETEQDKIFNEYQQSLKQDFGVTPSVLLQVLKNDTTITREKIDKAARVTRRMKMKNDIGKSVAGFFIKALQNEYTDEIEENRVKKKADEEKKKKYEAALLNALDEKESAINEKIRDLVQKDSSITKSAINEIRSNPFAEQLIDNKTKQLGRELNIDDYREDQQLRKFVKNQIVELNKTEFASILFGYEQKVKAIKNQFKSQK